MKTHLRIHLANDLTWCGRPITYGRKAPLTNVVTFPKRLYDLSNIKYVDGKIDYTPMTREERHEYVNLWNATVRKVTCLKCTKNGSMFGLKAQTS